MDGWKTVKTLAGIARAGAGQLIGNGARKLLERTASMGAATSARRGIHTSSRVMKIKPPPLRRQGPMPLPRAEQAEFEALVKKAQGSGISLEDARAQAKPAGPNADLIEHRDLRRQPKKEFEGETNPRTGEVGGPKRDPFAAGDNDWQYSGRVTDF